MIKRIIGVATMLFMVIAMNAQEKDKGLRVGYQSSVMTVDGKDLGSSGNSFYINAYSDTKIVPFVYFHSGLQYSQNSSTIEGNDYKINYLGVPVALKAKVGPVYALGGAAFNVKLNEKNNPFENSSSWYDTNAFAGVGVNILFLTAEARYMWGLTDINNGIENNSFQIGLGLRF